jgi:UDP-glucuronate 4-epimerase
LSTLATYRVVNVSGGRPVMLETLIQATERELGRSARRNLLPAQPGDVPATHADVALLQALTDYRPQTELDAGIRTFVAWYRAYTPAD